MNEQAQQHRLTRSNRLTLLLIIGIPILIILLSSLMYWLAENRVVALDTVNNGTLITPPLQIDEIPLHDRFGNNIRYQQLDPVWTLLVVGDGGCDSRCEQLLYLTRQTHIASGKLMNDIRRAYLALDTEPVTDSRSLIWAEDSDRHLDVAEQPAKAGAFVKSNSELLQWRVNRSDWLALFADSAVDPLAENTVFLVDRRGWVMMHYQAADLETMTLSVLSKGIIKDMKRLLQ